MNRFDKRKIEDIIKLSEDKQDTEISQDIYGVIYSLGRDASNNEEFHYAYAILLKLCKHANSHIRAYTILALSLLADSNVLEKDIIIPIVVKEWKENKKYRRTIEDAVDDLNFKLKWRIKLK